MLVCITKLIQLIIQISNTAPTADLTLKNNIST